MDTRGVVHTARDKQSAQWRTSRDRTRTESADRDRLVTQGEQQLFVAQIGSDRQSVCRYLYRVHAGSLSTSRGCSPLGVVSCFAETAAACPDAFSEATGCVRRKPEAETGQDCFCCERLATRSFLAEVKVPGRVSCATVTQMTRPYTHHYAPRNLSLFSNLCSAKLNDMFAN